MKILYIADDGKEFEDENECMEYEKIQEAEKSGVLNEIHALDDKFREMKVGNSSMNYYDMETMLGHVLYVKFDSIKAAEYFDEQLNYYGYDTISVNNALKADVYAYHDGKNEWELVTEIVEHYQGILDKFTERK